MLKRLISSVALLLIGTACLGWGEVGHRTAGVIATKYLTEKTTAAVADLLGDRTVATAGTWADELRKDKSYDWAKPLHYINLPMDAKEIDLARDCPPGEGGTGECVLGAINRFSDVLRDSQAAQAQKSEALKFLIHFIEDLHQPLHVSYAKDRGGNMITLSFLGKTGANLHRVWDTDMIEQRVKQTTDGDWMKYAIDLRDKITEADLKKYRRSADPVAWANESFEITRRLYKSLPTSSGNIDADYVNRWMPTVEERLTAAGVRLAMHLNGIFDPRPVTPTDPPSEPTPRAPDSPATAPASQPASSSR
jgi:hypothetical protein